MSEESFHPRQPVAEEPEWNPAAGDHRVKRGARRVRLATHGRSAAAGGAGKPRGRPRRLGVVEPATAGGEAPQARGHSLPRLQPERARASGDLHSGGRRRVAGVPRALLAAARGEGEHLHLDGLSGQPADLPAQRELLPAGVAAEDLLLLPASPREGRRDPARRRPQGPGADPARGPGPLREPALDVRPQLRGWLRPRLADRVPGHRQGGDRAALPDQGDRGRVEGRRPPPDPCGSVGRLPAPQDGRDGLVQPRDLLPRLDPGFRRCGTPCWRSSPTASCRRTPTTATALQSSPRCSTSSAPPITPRPSAFLGSRGTC